MTKESERRYFDIVVVIPLEEELNEFVEYFEIIDDLSTEYTYRCSVKAGQSDLTMLVVKQDGMGKSEARTAIEGVSAEFDFGLVICLGIAGGISGDVKLGDVCISRLIADVTENAKIADSKTGGVELSLSNIPYRADRKTYAAMNFVRVKADQKHLYLEWQNNRKDIASKLFSRPVRGRDGKPEEIGAPKAIDGILACGLVTSSEQYNTLLKKIDRKLLAIETESGGIFAVTEERGIPTVTLRGVSDYADPGKKRLEDDTASAMRKFATGNAASFLRLQFGNPDFLSAVGAAKESGSGAERRATADIRTLGDVISEIDIAIDEKLRELSPTFRALPSGYRLPMPRLRQLEESLSVPSLGWSEPTDAYDALKKPPAIIIKLPRSYPDRSFPWVLADNILGSEVDGKQLLPLVIDGANLAPPRKGPRETADISLVGVQGLDDAQVVYVIYNVPVTSGTKRKFLSKILDESSAKFIFICQDDDTFVEALEFAKQNKLAQFDLLPISFTEIAAFVQRSFDIESVESEVIATKLFDLFKRFDLSAHPTYFAGLKRDTILGLLLANRRSELIQLAVDGFLLFLVAGDSDEINLTRSTRARFLKNLAVQINVEKRNFTEEGIVEFARSFATEYDFAIQPIGFVQAFIERGILRVVSQYVQFSLPFVENYLLASALVEDPELAKRYFHPSEDSFDLATFDLYAEMGASPHIVNQVELSLDAGIEEFAIEAPQDHVLLGDKIRPAFIRTTASQEALRRRLDKAVQDVQKNVGNVAEKQRMLDFAERLGGTVKKATDEQSAIKQPSNDSMTDKLAVAVKRWNIAVVLLGSGAETLKGATKQNLAKKILELGSLLLHHWISDRAKFDFAEIKKNILADEELGKFELPDEVKKTSGFTAKALIEFIADILEYIALAQPFSYMMGSLCEQARYRVLAPSIEKISADGQVISMLRAAWLTDIESSRGLAGFKTIIKRFPTAPFTRTMLANHFIFRAQWHQWTVADRLALLGAAEETLKVLGRRIDKETLREIKKLTDEITRRELPDVNK